MLEKLVGTFAKVNVDEHPDLASHYGIQSIPTLVIFKDGEYSIELLGLSPKKALMQRIDKLTTSV
jgi:thioredoxin